MDSLRRVIEGPAHGSIRFDALLAFVVSATGPNRTRRKRSAWGGGGSPTRPHGPAMR